MDLSTYVSYDGFNFGDNGIVLTLIDRFRVAKRNNQLEKIANKSGAVLVQSDLGTKPITLEGEYTGATREDADLMYDILTGVLNRQERPLIVPHAGGTRQFTATPENIVIDEPNGLNRITFSFEFVVPSGASDGTETVQLINEAGITTATTTIPLDVSGSVAARPTITITFNTVTGGTGKTVTIRNARDFIGLTFARDFVSGDEIIIDCENFQIYINGVLTEPDGRLPSWSTGPGALYYSDTFTTRNVDITATYEPRNL